MEVCEWKYYTARNGSEINLDKEEARRVHGELERMDDSNETRSCNTSKCRAYSVIGGEIEYSIGNQPELVIRAVRKAELSNIAKRYGLPCLG